MRFDTLDTMVRDICEIGGADFNHRRYGTVMKTCIRTLQDLNLFTQIPNYKTVMLEVLPNLTARMPDDVLRPVKIGLCENGRVREIRYAEDICLDKANLVECCECEEKSIQALPPVFGEQVCDYEVVVDGGGQCCDYSVEGIDLFANCFTVTFPEDLAFDETSGGFTYFAIQANQFAFSNYPAIAGLNIGNITTLTPSINEILDALEESFNSKEFWNESNPDVFTFERLPFGFKICYTGEDFLSGIRVSLGDGSHNQGLNPYILDFNGQVTIIENQNDFTKTVEFALNVPDNQFQVLINDVWTDVTDEVVNGTWTRTNVCDGTTITEWRIVDSEENVIDSGEVTAECTGESILPEGSTLWININGEFVDKTDEVENGAWVARQTADTITEWEVRDSEGEVTASGEVDQLNCNTPVIQPDIPCEETQVDRSCDSKGNCKKCGKKKQNNTAANLQGYPDQRNFGDAIVAQSWYSQYAAFYNYNEIRGGVRHFENYGQAPYPPFRGWFNYDLVNGIIKLDGNFSEGDQLLFMYRTEMQELDGTKVVPVECFNMLLYRCKELIFPMNRVDTERNRMLYETEYKRIKRLYNKMTVTEWEEALGGYRYSSVKR